MRIAFVSKDRTSVECIEDFDDVPTILPEWAIAVTLEDDEACELNWGYKPNSNPRFYDRTDEIMALQRAQVQALMFASTESGN
jgi:hypothetical protein